MSKSISSTIQSLQRFYADLPERLSTEDVRKKAQTLADPELAVRVHRLLPKRKSTTAEFTFEEVTEAFLQLVLNEETALTPKGAIHFRSILRAAGRNFGVAFSDLYEVAMSTGFGIVPSLEDLAREFQEFLHSAGEKAGAERTREQRRQRIKERVAGGQLEAWRGAFLLEWVERYGDDAEKELSVSELEALLTDDSVLNRLSKVEGMSWDALAAQAHSYQSHRRIGAALAAAGEVAE